MLSSMQLIHLVAQQVSLAKYPSRTASKTAPLRFSPYKNVPNYEPHLLAAVGSIVIFGVVAELLVVLVVDVLAVGDPAQPAPLGLLLPQPLVVSRHPAVSVFIGT